jgi:hypothetical protein
LTITADHDSELLNQSQVGFGPLPGLPQYLLRGKKEMVNFTEDTCPFARSFDEWGPANFIAFFTVTDATVGVVSAHGSQS